MDQVDEIILMSLRRLGVPFADDSVSKIQQLDSDTIVHAVVMCVNAIDPECEGKYPTRLPESMSLRFRMCSEIAEKIKHLGYKSDIGYQTLLYPNETELRRLFMFLVENLPRDQLDTSATSASEFLDPTTRLKLQLASVLQKQIQEPWKPHYLGPKNKQAQRVFRTHCDMCSKEELEIGDVSKKGLVPELVELNSVWSEREGRRSVTKVDSDAMRAKIEELENEMKEREQEKLLSAMSRIQSMNEDGLLKTPRGVDETAEGEMERQTELNELQTQSTQLTDKYGEALRKIESCIAKTKAAVDRIEELSGDLKSKEAMYKSMKKTFDLLPTAQESIERLESFLQSAEERMTSLQSQFEAHYLPLQKERDQLKQQLEKEVTPAQKMQREVNELEAKLQQLSSVNKEKEEAIRMLSSETKSVDQTRSRQVFTDKIFDIIGQIHKQKLEIDKIKVENYDLMRDVVSLNGKLDRAFHVTDEIIFNDATRDETAKKCYKLLATLHENCQALLSGIDETASLNREVRELEDQIDLESKKKTVKNLEKMKQDLEQVRQEKKDKLEKQRQMQRNAYMSTGSQREENENGRSSSSGGVGKAGDDRGSKEPLHANTENDNETEPHIQHEPVAAPRFVHPLDALS